MESGALLGSTAVDAREHLSFREFVYGPFRWGYQDVEGVFGFGAFHRDFCDRIAENKETCTLACRGGLKSTVFRAYIGWLIWELPFSDRNIEVSYMSYKQSLAAEHTTKAKEYIEANRLYEDRGIVSLSHADTILKYRSVDSGRQLVCKPYGVFSAKRGLHPDVLLADDILTDPAAAKPLDISQIVKVTNRFNREIRKMPKVGTGQLHVVGTPQDEHDIYFELKKNRYCDWALYPAISPDGKLLWPEVLTSERLQEDLTKMGRNAFLQEMLCIPRRSVEGFFRRRDFRGLIMGLGDTPKLGGVIVGGYDYGKKRHPAHVSLLRMMPVGETYDKYTLWQIPGGSIWMDHWSRNRQVQFLNQLIKKLKIVCLEYDDTRGELEGFAERKELAREMIPVCITGKKKWELGQGLDIAVTTKQIHLLSEVDENGYDRQLEQILAVDGNLDAMETPQGHADSFWSNALAIHAAQNATKHRSALRAYRSG